MFTTLSLSGRRLHVLSILQVMKAGGMIKEVPWMVNVELTVNTSCRKPMEEASSETLAEAVIKPRWQEKAKKSVSKEHSLSTGDTGT